MSNNIIEKLSIPILLSEEKKNKKKNCVQQNKNKIKTKTIFLLPIQLLIFIKCLCTRAID